MMPLLARRRPSYAVVYDKHHPSPDTIVMAAEFLAKRDLYGFLLLNDDLIVTEQFGAFSEDVSIGAAVCDVVLPLMGLEDSILALQSDPQMSVDVPNVSVRPELSEAARVNVLVYWVVDRAQYLVLLMRALSHGELELELRRQTQARRLVEDELLQKTKQIALANAELARANRELEDFAYVISHDLKAPLRALRYLCGDLNEQLPGAMTDGDKAATMTIDQIGTQTQRMDAMLDGLLAYARVGRTTEAIEDVNTGLLVDSIINSLPRPAEFRIQRQGDFPILLTLPAPLDLILRNLIDNAIKHHDRPAGCVDISAYDDGDRVVFTVADDGPGVEPAFHTAIFDPYCKVDDEIDPVSSGIGLALVDKTAEIHGASITLTSDPKCVRGCVFKLSWPRAVPGQHHDTTA